MILFYCLDPSRVWQVDAPLPLDTEIRFWAPRRDGFPPLGPWTLQNALWWLFRRLHLFSRPDFAELTIRRGPPVLHRLVITPRWWRFPFMDHTDLQFGNLWTHPAARRQGLARAAIIAAERSIRSRPARIWYVTESANSPSIQLIESCGYRLAGTGVRTAPLGIRALGRFHLRTANEARGVTLTDRMVPD